MLPGLARFSVASLMSTPAQDQGLFGTYGSSYPPLHSMDKSQVFANDCYRRQEYGAAPPAPASSAQQFWANNGNAWCSPPGIQYGGPLNTYNPTNGKFNLAAVMYDHFFCIAIADIMCINSV